MVYTRLHRRLALLGLQSITEYCELLKSNEAPDELTHLIDTLSTNFTTFFREIEHFKFLKEKVLPDFLASGLTSHGPFRAWSAGCSTGEEPYSLAILLAARMQAIDRDAWQIFASDISTRVLEKASQGIYESDRVRLPNPAWLSQYFQKGRGDWTGFYRVKERLREQVEFRHMNLIHPEHHTDNRYHLIFCRNVIIYFDQATTQELVQRLYRQLHAGGYLIIGHAENLSRKPRGLQQVQSSIFRRSSP